MTNRTKDNIGPLYFMPAPKGNEYLKLRKSNGTKPKFDDPEEFWDKCCEYFEWVEANPIIEKRSIKVRDVSTEVEVNLVRPMSLAGLLEHIGLDEDGFERIGKIDGYAYFFERAKSVIYVQTFEAAAAGLISPEDVAWEMSKGDEYGAAKSPKEGEHVGS
ncbi:terminase small subunit [Pelagicoccus sp. SDUM812003]|uniref:terminase small subunit n=1 Tax=Pelagicoccus sp. SDUM812003 TaxID=3041267 RepID=UPI00280EA5FE|nr:terminase small subunit [Pelagicoccus sp. SDUM812003]MDQ8202788.1 terminase small subunit [Pelagicoccus sp. SDUM812003]